MFPSYFVPQANALKTGDCPAASPASSRFKPDNTNFLCELLIVSDNIGNTAPGFQTDKIRILGSPDSKIREVIESETESLASHLIPERNLSAFERF